MPCRRRRKTNFSPSETLLLLKKVEENTEVINSIKSNSNQHNLLKQQVWDGIAKEVSAVSGSLREAKEIKKKWVDLRTAVHKHLREKKKNPLNPETRQPRYMTQILTILGGISKPTVDIDVTELVQQLGQRDEECEDMHENGTSFQILQVESLASDDTSHIILETTSPVPENRQVTADTKNSHQVTEDSHPILDKYQVTASVDEILGNIHQATANTSHIPGNSHQVAADVSHMTRGGHQMTPDTHHNHEKNSELTTNTVGFSQERNNQMTSDISQIPERRRISNGDSSLNGPRCPFPERGRRIRKQNNHIPNGMAYSGDMPQVFDASNASTVILKVRERASENTYDEIWDRWLESEISVNEKRKKCMDAYLEVMQLKKVKLQLDISGMRNAERN